MRQVVVFTSDMTKKIANIIICYAKTIQRTADHLAIVFIHLSVYPSHPVKN